MAAKSCDSGEKSGSLYICRISSQVDAMNWYAPAADELRLYRSIRRNCRG